MKKFLAIIMAMAMLLSLCACGGEKEENPDAADTTVAAEAEDNTEKEDKKDNMKAQKIGSKSIGESIYGNGSAFVYTDNETDLKGLVSADGSVDTGAKYYELKPFLNCYTAETKTPTAADDFDGINSTIIIDSLGKEIISEGYCLFENLSDKYVSAAKVIEQTTDKSDFDVRFYSDWFKSGLVVQDEDLLYNAEFHIYDITTGKRLESFTLYDSNINVYGDVICYRENGEWIYKNAKGETIPEDAYDISSLDGYYTMEDNDKITVYNAFGEALFICDSEKDFVPTWYENGCFICINESTDKIAVFDEAGTMISSEMPVVGGSRSAEIKGDYIVVKANGVTNVYDYEGNLVKKTDGIFHYNEENPQYYAITDSDDNMTILDTEGNILFEIEADDTYDTIDCLAYKEIDDEEYYFCVKDKDFTIKGDENIDDTYYVGIEHEDDSWEIVDTISGKTVLEGEGDVDYAINGENVYICIETEDGVYDFYKI